MSAEGSASQLNVESLKVKVENQQRLIRELTSENEELYHQYNHLMIRNGKMLKRIDDLQKIIDDLHVRIEELQLINGNMMQINDRLRVRNDYKSITEQMPSSSFSTFANNHPSIDTEELFRRWKSYPGQIAQNAPNLRKQVAMLTVLYNTKSLNAGDLFQQTGIGGVTGARYVSTLKKFGMIRFTGARKKGHYEITRKGIDFIENTYVAPNEEEQITGKLVPLPETESIGVTAGFDHHDL